MFILTSKRGIKHAFYYSDNATYTQDREDNVVVEWKENNKYYKRRFNICEGVCYTKIIKK